MNAAVPFGMESADFRDLMATVAIAFAAALVLVVLAIVVRDILVARYAAQGRQEERERPVRPRGGSRPSGLQPQVVTNVHGSHLPPVSGAGIPRLYEHEIPVSPREHPQLAKRVAPPKTDPEGARLRTPSPASDRPAPPKGSGGIAPPRKTVEHRISARADRDADRTRLDLNPTEGD